MQSIFFYIFVTLFAACAYAANQTLVVDSWLPNIDENDVYLYTVSNNPTPSRSLYAFVRFPSGEGTFSANFIDPPTLGEPTIFLLSRFNHRNVVVPSGSVYAIDLPIWYMWKYLSDDERSSLDFAFKLNISSSTSYEVRLSQGLASQPINTLPSSPNVWSSSIVYTPPPLTNLSIMSGAYFSFALSTSAAGNRRLLAEVTQDHSGDLLGASLLAPGLGSLPALETFGSTSLTTIVSTCCSTLSSNYFVEVQTQTVSPSFSVRFSWQNGASSASVSALSILLMALCMLLLL
eukprot:TRINITY_DN7633_c0_g1_i1.p1 TRINITY_DN7633_c0_g1~~TRINITY_DN7633_c0_g1_i1.p1  ORF type:complete len:290 (+),score=49.66 TRINITY_DN7633_c0_g1_i1:29-898(+)